MQTKFFPKRSRVRRGVAALAVTTGLAAVLTTAPVGTATGENAVLEWNRYAVGAGAAINQNPVIQLRSMAIVHVAMSDAVQAIAGGVETYLDVGEPPAGASADAAAIAAGFTTLDALYPADDFSDELTASLITHSVSVADPGFAFGEAVAAAMLNLRSADGASAAQYPYTAANSGAPGVWVGNSASSAVLPGWGYVTPFVIQDAAQFRPDGPPALDSGRYARDYNEVKEYGSTASTVRTSDQSNIARFWLATPTALGNPLARQVIESRQLGLSETARTLALMYVAGVDASIACWDAKYAYNFWRPMQAIRRGNEDGNDATEPDPAWTPFLGNPQHPEYLSGHSTATGAINGMLALIFGDDPGIPLIGTSPTNAGFERTWTTFGEAVDEVIAARIWGGFHYRTSDEVGARVGSQVARFVMQRALRPLPGTGESQPELASVLLPFPARH